MNDKFDRRKFLQTAGLIAAAGVINPFDVLGAAAGKQTKSSAKSSPALDAISADVVVVGAGPSGIPAAIAAARHGARVILLEEDQVPGGAPVDMYVDMLCGTPRVGIFREMCQLLDRKYTTSGTARPDFGLEGSNGKNHWYLPSSYMMAVSEMMAAEENLQLICGAHVSELILKESANRNLVQGVVVYRNGRRQEIRGAVTIDATGTGLLGELAGAPSMYGRDGRAEFGEPIGMENADDQVQPCTWQFITQSLRPGADLSHWKKLKWKGMVEDNHRWVKAEDASRTTGLFLHWGGRFYCKDTRDPVELAKTQAEALESLMPDFEIYHQAGYMVHLAPKIGVREVRRIRGEYVIDVNHLKAGLFPEDTIAHCNYGLDVWGEKISKEDVKTRPYGIPYRSLLPLNVEGLILAGKAISGSHLAQGSFRVQPIVASIGQAAGTAAAMAALNKTSLRNVDLANLLSTLGNDGLFMGRPKRNK